MCGVAIKLDHHACSRMRTETKQISAFIHFDERSCYVAAITNDPAKVGGPTAVMDMSTKSWAHRPVAPHLRLVAIGWAMQLLHNLHYFRFLQRKLLC